MKIVISTEGGWGASTPQDKVALAETLKASLDFKFRNDTNVCEVVIEDEVKVENGLKTPRPDILVFLSRSEIAKARAIKKAYPTVRVVVLTGLIPTDEVVVAATSWAGQKSVVDFVLRG